MGRAYKASYAGPERFTAFGGTFCKIERSAAPELYAMAQAFPKEFSRALRFAGNLLRAELKAALRGSGGLRASWPELSRMHRYRRMDMLKAVGGGITAGVSSSNGGSALNPFPGGSG